jgi:hypothetical protein
MTDHDCAPEYRAPGLGSRPPLTAVPRPEVKPMMGILSGQVLADMMTQDFPERPAFENPNFYR